MLKAKSSIPHQPHKHSVSRAKIKKKIARSKIIA
jgi:hypothetical protein